MRKNAKELFMNYLVTYRCSNGYLFKKKTYTYPEANAVAEHAISKGYSDVSVTPLGERATLQMVSVDFVKELFDEFSSQFSK